MSNSGLYPESFEKWWAEVTDPKAPRVVQAKDYAFIAWQKGVQDAEEFYSRPANTAEAPKIQHILTRNQRDALCAVNAFLSELQKGQEGSRYFHRVQKSIDVISDMLYGE